MFQIAKKNTIVQILPHLYWLHVSLSTDINLVLSVLSVPLRSPQGLRGIFESFYVVIVARKQHPWCPSVQSLKHCVKSLVHKGKPLVNRLFRCE